MQKYLRPVHWKLIKLRAVDVFFGGFQVKNLTAVFLLHNVQITGRYKLRTRITFARN